LNYAPIDPRFGVVYYIYSGGSNNYNGVIVSGKHTFGGGSIISAGYTFGKILDNGAGGVAVGTGSTDFGAVPDPYNVNKFYGPAASDIRHNFVLDYVYKFPFGHGAMFLSHVNNIVDAADGRLRERLISTPVSRTLRSTLRVPPTTAPTRVVQTVHRSSQSTRVAGRESAVTRSSSA
jgi:hypothetical protein